MPTMWIATATRANMRARAKRTDLSMPTRIAEIMTRSLNCISELKKSAGTVTRLVSSGLNRTVL